MPLCNTFVTTAFVSVGIGSWVKYSQTLGLCQLRLTSIKNGRTGHNMLAVLTMLEPIQKHCANQPQV
jgi:hypothetical protein